MTATHSVAIRTRVWRSGTLEAENFPIERVSDYLAEPDCVVWADVLYPDDHIIGVLAEELSLDPHAVEDAMGPHERPKVARYPSHFFLTAYAVGHDASAITLGRVSSFAVPHGLVTVRLDETLDLDSVLRRWDENADLIKYGSRALVYGLLDELVDRYFDAVDTVDTTLEGIEDVLFEENARTGHEVSRRAFEARRSLAQLRKAVLPMREVVSTIMHRVGDLDGSHQLMPYYEDLYDHVIRASEWTESLRDLISSIFETNMSLSDTRMNLIMKKLTAWAAIIAVPTAVTGYFGQNVPYPGFAQTSGFWFSLILMIVIAAALYVTFRRKDWL
jgi:magnesium transporter